MNKNAFTLIEVLVTLAIIMILVGALAGTGQYLRTRSGIQLTTSTIRIIDAALEQYHEQYKKYPFSNRIMMDGQNRPQPIEYTRVHLEADTGMTSITPNTTLVEKDGTCYASSIGLYYFLDRGADSKAMLETLSNRMITTLDAETGQHLKMVMGGKTYDLPRFVDAWGISLRYEYISKEVSAGNFYPYPKMMSAGPDKVFGTSDDLSN
ncbi:MAG: type II secretion system protein [Sedimentisphaerales bacterium]|nr:type II secretion system protein [Sedimentisphaerales bacterium]